MSEEAIRPCKECGGELFGVNTYVQVFLTKKEINANYWLCNLECLEKWLKKRNKTDRTVKKDGK